MPIVPVVSPNDSMTPDVPPVGVTPMHNYAPEEQIRAGETTQRAGMASAHAAQEFQFRLQDQMNDAAVKAAEGQFIKAGTDILHGDNGYMLKQGAAAVDSYDATAQDLAKAKQDISDSLTNDVQRAMFNRVSMQHLTTFGSQMQQHRAQQRIEYSANESLGRADSMRSMAQSADIGSRDQLSYIETGVKELQNAMSAKGIPADSEQAKKAERQYRSLITQDNVSRLMEDGKYEEANTLLTEQMQAGNMEADTGDRLRRAIRGNLLRTESIKTAENIFAPYATKDLRGEDLESMLTEAQKVKNPEQREQVENYVKQKFTEQHQIQQMEYRDNLNDVVNYKAAHGSLKGVDPVKWGKLDAKDQADLTRPPAVETDLNTWYQFITKPDTLTLDNVKQAFTKGLLTKGDFKNFTELAMRQGNKADYIQEAGDINGRINYFANQSGMNVYGMKDGKDTPQTAADKMQHGALTYAVQNEIDRVKAQNHGKVTPEQVDAIIKRQLTQQTIQQLRSPWSPAAWFGNKTFDVKVPTYQMPPRATGTQMGKDGLLHYTDGTRDLGVVK